MVHFCFVNLKFFFFFYIILFRSLKLGLYTNMYFPFTLKIILSIIFVSHCLLQFGATVWCLKFCFYKLFSGQVYFLLTLSRALHQSGSCNVNQLGERQWFSFSPDLYNLWYQVILTRGLWHFSSLFW